MHRFEFTDPDGDRLTVQPLTRADGTHVLDMTSTEQGKDTLHRASVFVPLDRVEEVIAGMRSAARSAGHAPGTVTVGLVFPEGDELAGTVRAAVGTGPAVPAPRAAEQTPACDNANCAGLCPACAPPPPAVPRRFNLPTADYHSAWTELTGYVREAANDGGTITPADLLAYMQELRRNALAPAREWMRRITDGEPTP